ncbi:hypothetical protein CPB83DRAFT_881946 [Crepidotus variabilis]|uniref:Uncharacterized protein n=1 Tax=Crepidotus variabilis TaxID=179855 RepID=A0A9P6EJ79_9AGAR|nr:hypothetical protein CPB83DRAFT_881946 [Crepidotus variabilis]
MRLPAMKDFLTPVGTPFSLANDPSTPNSQGHAHYFAESHRHAVPAEYLVPEGAFGTPNDRLHLAKLQINAGRSHVEAQEPQCPLEALPTEIISLILELGYFNPAPLPPDADFRELALAISFHLRNIALQTPSLWSVVRLTPGNVSNELDFLPVYLPRSKGYPLHVHLDCLWQPEVTDRIMDHLKPHSTHLGHLSVTTGNDHVLQSLQITNAPFLTALSLRFFSKERRTSLPSPIFNNSLPRLKYLRLHNVDLNMVYFSLHTLQTLEIRGHGIWPTFSRLADMLGGSTSLQRLTLHVKPERVLHQVQEFSQDAAELSRLEQNRVYLPNLLRFEVFTSEWLTKEICELVQLFNCPKLEGFILRDASNAIEETPNTVIAYSQLPSSHVRAYETNHVLAEGVNSSPFFTNHPNRLLWVNRGNLYHACRAMTYSMESKLTTLELHRAFFPSLVETKEAFSSLKSLSYLSIFEFSATEHLSSMMDFTDLNEVHWESFVGILVIPSLKQLFLDFWRNDCEYPGDIGMGVKHFINLFHVAGLSSLVLKGMKEVHWFEVNEAFHDINKFPHLTSLKLIGNPNSFPFDLHSPRVNPTRTFPMLESLSLHDLVSNNITRLFTLPQTVQESDGLDIWPNLTTFTVTNDPLSSKPLLHRAIIKRRSIDRPIRQLFLDEPFTRNQESLLWMKEHVDSLRIIKWFSGSALALPIGDDDEENSPL